MHPRTARPATHRVPAVHLLLSLALLLSACAQSPEERAREAARRAEAAWAERHYEAALAHLEEAHALVPDDTTVALKLAQAYSRRFLWDKGMALCWDVLDREPNRADAWRVTAVLAMASGHMDEALRAVETLKRLDPDGAESLALCGDFYLLQNDPEAALRAYEAALASSGEAASAASAADPTVHSSNASTAGGSRLEAFRSVLQAKKAACLLALDQPREALHLVETLATSAPSHPEVWSHLGRVWELLGRKDEAARAYEAAFALDPGDLSPMVRRIRLALNENRLDEVQTALDRLEQAGASPSVTVKLRIEWALHAGNPEEAARLVESARSRGAVDTELRLMESKIRLLQDRPTAALLILEKVLDLEPSIPTAHYLAGLAHLRSNHVRLAQKSMIRALELNPAFSEARLILAATYYKLGEREPARSHAQALAEREPENPDARILLALLAAEDGAIQEAARHAKALALLGGDPGRAQAVEALVQDQAGDRDRAMETALHAWDERPSDTDAGWAAVRLLCRTGRGAEALPRLERARNLRPDAAVWHVLAGDLFLCLKRPEEARAAYAQALALEPGTASAYRGLGRCEEASEEALRRILLDFRRHVGHSAEPTAALADLALSRKDPVSARKILEQDLAVHPDSGVLANNLAWLYLESGECTDKALALAQQAYDRLPHRADVLDTLGYAYFKKGLYARALWYLSEARAKAPENPFAAYHLGLLHAAQGDADPARLHLETALRLGLPAPAAAHAAATLDGLSSPPQTQ